MGVSARISYSSDPKVEHLKPHVRPGMSITSELPNATVDPTAHKPNSSRSDGKSRDLFAVTILDTRAKAVRRGCAIAAGRPAS
jgi:hypothetical protein